MEVTTENKKMTITTDEGSQEVLCEVVTTKDGVDEEGNPKISVEIKVPPIDLGAEPGKVE
jgi:hypothetical protein